MTTKSGKVGAYFSHLVSHLGGQKDVHCVAVAHMVPNTLHFASALASLTKLEAILAKPKTVYRPEHLELSAKFPMPDLSREWASNPAAVVETLEGLGLKGKKVVLVDIGGYFATSLDEIAGRFDGHLLGLMEGTENGVAKYEGNLPRQVPIVTVARSPLKLPEDHLVASSIVFSIEAVLREQAEILQTRSAAVLGYGRVGSSVAEILRGRGINTVVHDQDPVKLAEAAAKGFQANIRLNEALAQASLVVCATGNKSLSLRGFGMLRSGCVVASVTSADDEFDLDCLNPGYLRDDGSPNLVKYTETRGRRHFFLIAGGEAANFLHGAVIGPAIQLIEGEKLMAVKALIEGSVPQATNRLYELPDHLRREVAEIWIEHFL